MATVNIDILANVNSAIASISKLAGAFKLLLGAVALKTLVNNITEAEDAAAQLDAAFKATGKTLGLTRNQLDGLATEIQQTTKFSDDLVKQAESILLTFNRVRGEAFERTIKAAADLSARLGIDLVSATRLLGRALQDPQRGLTALSRSGVTFSESQRNLIKRLVEGGQAAKAQSIILSDLEKRFGGSATAARNTLAGALEGLKNSFGDLFEGTKQGTESAVGSINNLSKAFNDPKLKEAIDQLIALLAKFTSVLITAFTDLVRPVRDLVKAFQDLVGTNAVEFFELLAKAIAKVNIGKNVIDNITFVVKEVDKASDALERFRITQGIALTERRLKLTDPEDVRQVEFLTKKLANLQSQQDRLNGKGGAQRRFKRRVKEEDKGAIAGGSTEDIEEFESAVTEIVINEKKKRVDANQVVLDELDEQTKTSQEKQIEAYNKTKAALDELVEQGAISKQKADERLGEALDQLLPEIDIGEIRAMYKQIETQSSETAEIVKGAFREAGASIQRSLSEAIAGGKFSLRSLVDVAKQAFADIASALIVSGIKKLFLNSFGGGGGGFSAGSSGLSESFLASTFAPRAGGGLVPQGNSAIVGEEGRELVTALPGGGLRVMNKRQMSTTGGATVIYSPTNNISIIERENSQQTKQEIFQFVQIQNAKDREELYRKLAKNGVTIR